MTNQELYRLLKTTGYPVAYHHFKTKEVAIPFLLYFDDSLDTFNADDKVYSKSNSYKIYLATEKKDIEAENKVETLLDNNHIPYYKRVDFIEEEQIYQIEYEI